jgi:hypothetical protein
MIAQIEDHVKHERFEQALTLLPLLKQTFADHPEMLWAIKALQRDLETHNKDTLNTLQQLKQVLVG